MNGAEAFPYPDDAPEAMRGLVAVLSGLAEGVGAQIDAVRGGRNVMAARWASPAGGRAVAEVDAIGRVGGDAKAALADAQAPLEDYAGALDGARGTSDWLPPWSSRRRRRASWRSATSTRTPPPSITTRPTRKPTTVSPLARGNRVSNSTKNTSVRCDERAGRMAKKGNEFRNHTQSAGCGNH